MRLTTPPELLNVANLHRCGRVIVGVSPAQESTRRFVEGNIRAAGGRQEVAQQSEQHCRPESLALQCEWSSHRSPIKPTRSAGSPCGHPTHIESKCALGKILTFSESVRQFQETWPAASGKSHSVSTHSRPRRPAATVELLVRPMNRGAEAAPIESILGNPRIQFGSAGRASSTDTEIQ